SASLPVLMRGAHAALSPNLGAPATPVPWQTLQVVSNVDFPAPLAAPAGSAAAGAPPAGAAAAATFVGMAPAGAAAAPPAAGAAPAGAAAFAAGAAAAGAFGSTATCATGDRRALTAASDIAGSSLRERAP